MKKKVRIIVIASIAVLAAAAAVWSALAPLKVEAVVLSPQTARVTFTEQGIYTYSEEYRVYPILSGEVLEVYVKEGDQVKKGDPLALISASDYENQIVQLESSIKGYNAQIQNLSITEQREKEELSAARGELLGHLQSLDSEIEKQKVTEELLREQIRFLEGAISANRSLQRSLRDEREYMKDEDLEGTYEYYTLEQMYASARTTIANSYAQIEQLKSGILPEGYFEGQRTSLQAQIDAIDVQLGKSYTGAMRSYYQAQIEGAQAGITQMTEKLGKAAIPAPADGVISEIPLSTVNTVSAQSLAAVLGQKPYVEVFVSTRSLDGMNPGDKVELLLEKQLGDEIIEGRIFQIDRKAQARISALGIEERKVRVLIVPAQPLIIGSSLDVRFHSYEQPEALVVPKPAVFEQDGQDYVWMVSEGALIRRPVVKGVETREGYIIDEGLSAGDPVLADADQSGLKEGRRADFDR